MEIIEKYIILIFFYTRNVHRQFYRSALFFIFSRYVTSSFSVAADPDEGNKTPSTVCIHVKCKMCACTYKFTICFYFFLLILYSYTVYFYKYVKAINVNHEVCRISCYQVFQFCHLDKFKLLLSLIPTVNFRISRQALAFQWDFGMKTYNVNKRTSEEAWEL